MGTIRTAQLLIANFGLVLLVAGCGPDKEPLATASGVSGGPTGSPTGNPPGNPTDGDPTDGSSTDTGGPGVGGCAQYLACVGIVTPDALPEAEAAFGPAGSCWQGDAALMQQCVSTCEASLEALGALFPAEPACGGGGTTGTTGTTGTSGTTGTTSDSPTTTSDPTSGGGAQFCQEACADDSDCTLDGMDLGFTCERGRCVGGTSVCTGDGECKTLHSGWVTDCASQAGCPGQICVDTGGGAGKCATAPSDFLSCEALQQDELEIMTIEGDMTVIVCGNTTAECDDGVCFDPCTLDSDCDFYAGHPSCNVGTGRCECSDDAHCDDASVPGWATCNAGVCGCGEDADCDGSPTADTCYEGACGCSSVDVCTNAPTFDGTTKVCDGF